MLIGNLVKRTCDRFATLSADISSQTAGSVVNPVFFRVPIQYEHLLSDSVEPFVAAATVQSMSLGEPISTPYPISRRLRYGLVEAQEFILSAYPGRYQVVPISGPVDPDVSVLPGRHAGVMFSGGVDSMFSLRRLLHQDVPENLPIKFAVFIKGFDLMEKDDQTYDACLSVYSKRLSEVGVELIPIETNIREILTCPWEETCGAVLAGIGLALAGGLHTMFLPSSNHCLTERPYGSDARLDHWFSTRMMDVVPHATSVHRIAKCKAISDWPLAHEILRVCWQNPNGLRNCGRCSKCRRTMIELELVEGLQHFSCFDAELPPPGLRRLCLPPSEEYFLLELVRYASEQRDDSLLQAALWLLRGHQVRWALGRIRRGMRLNGRISRSSAVQGSSTLEVRQAEG